MFVQCWDCGFTFWMGKWVRCHFSLKSLLISQLLNCEYSHILISRGRCPQDPQPPRTLIFVTACVLYVHQSLCLELIEGIRVKVIGEGKRVVPEEDRNVLAVNVLRRKSPVSYKCCQVMTVSISLAGGAGATLRKQTATLGSWATEYHWSCGEFGTFITHQRFRTRFRAVH